MDPNQQQLLLGYGGGKSSATYVDDVFSTHVYRGNSNLYKLNYIDNGIRLGTSNFGSSTLFTVEDEEIRYGDSQDWYFDNNDFTIECWIRSKQDTSSYFTALGQWDGSNNRGWMIRYSSQDIGTGWSFFYSKDGSNYSGSGGGTAMGSDISDGNWHHVAITRTGGNIRTFTDGTLNTTKAETGTFYNSNGNFTIGGQSTSGNYFMGLISNLRIVKDTALYTASFTPPTAALTNVSGTVFLGCQSSVNRAAATVEPFSPTIPGTKGPYAIGVGPFTGTESGRGGMVMTKSRTDGGNWGVYSTTQGHTKVLSLTSSNAADTNSATNEMISFDANGFTLGQNQNNAPNTNAQDMVAWTFAKQEGFFDIVTWTGTGIAKTIPHNLGSVPGCIMVKSTGTHGTSWRIYHRGIGNTRALEFSSANAQAANVAFWNNTDPTKDEFTVGSSLYINGNTSEYIAYVFAGGESTNANARSVRFTDGGASDYLSVPDDAAWDVNNHDFTMECWVRFHSHNGHDGIIHNVTNSGWSGGGWIFEPVSGTLYFYYQNTSNQTHSVQGGKIPLGVWQHMAITKSGTGSGATITIYQDGIKTGQGTQVGDIKDGTNPVLIGGQCVGADCDADISNVRITTGQVLYTSSFTPSTIPLTTTSQGAVASNVKLLCCNQSTANGYSVSPGAITAYNSPIANSFSPFDDPDGYKFGADEDKNIIKTGSYIGNGSTNGTEVNTGWQPAYILIKCAIGGATQNWRLLDTRRGLDFAGGYNERLYPSQNSQGSAANIIELTGRGFKFTTTDASVNGDGETYIYIAVRGTDGSVGKPVDQAIKTFNMDFGNGSSTIPCYNSGFAVDFGLEKRYMSASYDWWCTSRLTGGGYVRCGSPASQSGPITDYCWDSEDGYVGASWANSDTLSWMWRRGKGIDVVAYAGNGIAGRPIPHSLGQIPEMIWVKNRNRSEAWRVYHKGLNGGTNPWNYGLKLNEPDQESSVTIWNNTAPTSLDFTINADSGVNHSGEDIVAWLFASANDIEGNPISKVGYFSGSNTAKSISVGFRPRFLIIKCSGSNSKPWCVFDSVRGFAAGNDSLLQLNSAVAQTTGVNYGEFTATGFDLVGNVSYTNEAGLNYLYYAHA